MRPDIDASVCGIEELYAADRQLRGRLIPMILANGQQLDIRPDRTGQTFVSSANQSAIKRAGTRWAAPLPNVIRVPHAPEVTGLHETGWDSICKDLVHAGMASSVRSPRRCRRF